MMHGHFDSILRVPPVVRFALVAQGNAFRRKVDLINRHSKGLPKDDTNNIGERLVGVLRGHKDGPVQTGSTPHRFT